MTAQSGDGICSSNVLPFDDATSTTSLAALGMLIVCIRTCRLMLLEPFLSGIGTRAAIATKGEKWVCQNPENIDNFADFSFRFLLRCAVTALGLYEFQQSPEWWYDTRQLWTGYPHHEVSNVVQIQYLLQLAYHLDDLFTVLIQGKSNRKDYHTMIIHHNVTVLLLFGSTHLRATRIGCIVSTLHAITDVPKDFAKMAKQLEWSMTSRIGLAVLFLSWIGARLLLFPCVYLRSTFVEGYILLNLGMSLRSLNIFRALLSIISALNLIWFRMMLKLLYRIVKYGDAEDPTLANTPKLAESPCQSEEDDSSSSDSSGIVDETSTSAESNSECNQHHGSKVKAS